MRKLPLILFVLLAAYSAHSADAEAPAITEADVWRPYVNAATAEDQTRVIGEWLKLRSLDKTLARIRRRQEEARTDGATGDTLGAFALTLGSAASGFAHWPRGAALSIAEGKVRPSAEQFNEILRQAEFYTHYAQVFSYVLMPREPGVKPEFKENGRAGVEHGQTVTLANIADALSGLGELSGDARFSVAASKAWSVVDSLATEEVRKRAIEPRYSTCPKDSEARKRWIAAWLQKSRGYLGLLDK